MDRKNAIIIIQVGLIAILFICVLFMSITIKSQKEDIQIYKEACQTWSVAFDQMTQVADIYKKLCN